MSAERTKRAMKAVAFGLLVCLLLGAAFVQRFEVHPDDAEQARSLVAEFDARASEPDEGGDERPGDGVDGDEGRGRSRLKATTFYLGIILLLLLLSMIFLSRTSSP